MSINKWENEREPCVIEAIYLMCVVRSWLIVVCFRALLASYFICIVKYCVEFENISSCS